MTTKEFLESVRKAMINNLQESKEDYMDDNDQSGIEDLEDDIESVEVAKTIGEIADVACDRAWDVWSWNQLVLHAICDDFDKSILGDIPDHWST